MSLSFPSSPTTGQIASANGRTYTWTGYAWELVAASGGGTDSRWDLFLPPAPTSVTATAGNAQATVSWTAPTGVLAQAPITDYVLQYSSNSGSSWTTFSDGTSTATSATVTGLSNGTAYTLRVAAVNAVGTGAFSTASSAVTPKAGDALWSSVQLLLPGDTSIADASSYSRSVTASGNAAVSTSTKMWGSGSLAFDGSGDYVSIAGSALNLSSSDFVIEMWIRTTQTSLYATLTAKGSATWGAGYWGWMINHGAADGSLAVYVNNYNSGAPLMVTTGASVIDGNWHHIAWVRSGTAHALYVDGTRRATATASFTIASLSENISIGGDVLFNNRWFDGYIDDFRATVGSARGMTGSTITVPTAAFPNA